MVSSEKTCLGNDDCHTTSSPQLIVKSFVLAVRMRCSMRITAWAMLSLGVTNSQAPPVCSAKSRSKLSAGALPTPIANMRCCETLACLTMSSISQTSPSVISSKSQPSVKALAKLSLKVECNAASSSVPPMSASVSRMAGANTSLKYCWPNRSSWLDV